MVLVGLIAGASWASWASANSFAYTQANSGLYIQAVGGGRSQLTNGYLDRSPSWNSAGDKLVFDSRGAPNVGLHAESIYVVDSDGSNLTRLTNSGPGITDWNPDWNVVDDEIAFISNRLNPGAAGDIYTMNSDGTGVTQLTAGGGKGRPRWDPAGERIAYWSYSDDSIYVLEVASSNISRLTPSLDTGYTEPAWHPDGQQIAYTTYGGISVYSFSSGTSQVIFPGASCPSWNASGAEFRFVSGGNIYVSLDGAEPVQLASAPASCPEWQPTLPDNDNDGIPDAEDADDDNDLLPDTLEAALGTDPLNADTDGDGVSDGQEIADGTDPLAVPDQDSDTVLDAVDNCPATANADQLNLDGDAFGDACDDDIDGDGALNAVDAFPSDPTETLDTDGDLIGNNADDDDDGDQLSDAFEALLGTDPLLADSDGDGLSDYDEIAGSSDPNDPNDPAVAAVPALGGLGVAVLSGALVLTASRRVSLPGRK